MKSNNALKNKILVIGGANIDYIGKSFNKIIKQDSNIGTISISFGGVGRNIVENLARLGMDVTFITAIGDDFLGQLMLKELLELNVKVIMPKTSSENSGGYLAIHSENGDMELALCDQKITEKISIEFLESQKNIINEFDYIVIDTNFNQDVLKYLINTYSRKKIFLDVISTAKGKKIVGLESKISFLKCNELEARTLFTDNYFTNFNSNMLIVTKGSKTIEYNEKTKICYSNVEKVNQEDIVNATGAGDALFSGFICGIVLDKGYDKAFSMAKKLARLTLLSDGAVNKNISIKDIDGDKNGN